MKFLAYHASGVEGLAVECAGGGFRGLPSTHAKFPGWLEDILPNGEQALVEAAVRLADGGPIDFPAIRPLPPLRRSGKVICLGLNYVEHAAEGGFAKPEYPTLFVRFASGLIGARDPLVRPRVSQYLDYEGELVAIVGKSGRHIPLAQALSHIAGYSVFNDGSIRDYQLRTPQWTIGKNFDGTGVFGPTFVTADELPPGGRNLRIETRLNGAVVQSDNTNNMIFDVATTVSILSEAFELQAGDLLVMGTPAGIGFAREPKLMMKPGDICEVEIEGIGLLRNEVIDEEMAAA